MPNISFISDAFHSMISLTYKICLNAPLVSMPHTSMHIGSFIETYTADTINPISYKTKLNLSKLVHLLRFQIFVLNPILRVTMPENRAQEVFLINLLINSDVHLLTSC